LPVGEIDLGPLQSPDLFSTFLPHPRALDFSCGLLRGSIGQGWTSIRIKIVNVRQVGGAILIANEYAAIGSGENAGKTLNATSSHVLVESNGEWLATLHTAR
jgi:hypothetical protein